TSTGDIRLDVMSSRRFRPDSHVISSDTFLPLMACGLLRRSGATGRSIARGPRPLRVPAERTDRQHSSAGPATYPPRLDADISDAATYCSLCCTRVWHPITTSPDQAPPDPLRPAQARVAGWVLVEHAASARHLGFASWGWRHDRGGRSGNC